MIDRQIARYRIEDLIREAEGARRARLAGAARGPGRRYGIRRAASLLASAAAWPGRH
jgi:hypothetical protein